MSNAIRDPKLKRELKRKHERAEFIQSEARAADKALARFREKPCYPRAHAVIAMIRRLDEIEAHAWAEKYAQAFALAIGRAMDRQTG